MTPFFRFPHTPHLAWLGKDAPRDDKVLSPTEQVAFLAHELVIEEKVDGANTGISFDHDGNLLVQNRGAYLSEPYLGQYSKFGAWIRPRLDELFTHLSDRYILFGEWCYAQHSLDYTVLPDWFLTFDVYDRTEACFLDTARRNQMAASVGTASMPALDRGHFGLDTLLAMTTHFRSQFRNGYSEGVVIRQEYDGKTSSRAKIVRPDFVQAISEHWSRKNLVSNGLRGAHML